MRILLQSLAALVAASFALGAAHAATPADAAASAPAPAAHKHSGSKHAADSKKSGSPSKKKAPALSAGPRAQRGRPCAVGTCFSRCGSRRENGLPRSMRCQRRSSQLCGPSSAQRSTTGASSTRGTRP